MDVTELLLTQDGLITREQALAAGLSASAVDRRLAKGLWEVVHPRVYRAADHPTLPRTRVRAAVLWAGEAATLIGPSALAWWRFVDEHPTTVVLAVDPRAGHTAPAGIQLCRRAVSDADRCRVDGLWVLHRAPAVLEAAAALDPVAGARLVDRSLQEGRVSLDGLRRALASFGQRHGVVAARRLLELAEGGARSEAERRLLRGLRRGGVLGGVPNLSVALPGFGTVELDLAFPDRRLVIEVDGWAYHRDVDRFRRDARRQNALVVAGWRVLRVTWYDLVDDADGVVASVIEALARAA